MKRSIKLRLSRGDYRNAEHNANRSKKHSIAKRRGVMIIALALILAVSIAAGGCAKDSSGYSGSMSESLSAPSSSSFPGGYAGGGSAPQGAGAPNDTSGAGSRDESPVPVPILTPSSSRGKKMVYIVDMKLQTTEIMAGIRKLMTSLGNMNGYVETYSLKGRDLRYPDTERNATYTLRLDTEHLSEFILMVQENYNVLSIDQKSEDVTAKYEQTDSTLDDLREREIRLLKDLEISTLKASDRLDIEKELANVQTAIRNAEKQQAVYDDGIIYSTINVELFEVIFTEIVEAPVIPEPEFSEKLSDTATKSVNGFVAFCQGFLLVLIRIFPALIVIAVFGCIAYLIYRGVRKQRAKFRNAVNRVSSRSERKSDDEAPGGES